MTSNKHITIATDHFDDERILLIESRPDADAVLIVWIKLLILAGKTYGSGVFQIEKDRPLTVEELATIIRRSSEDVKKALDCFESIGLIEYTDGAVSIPEWQRYQSIDRLEKIKELGSGSALPCYERRSRNV